MNDIISQSQVLELDGVQLTQAGIIWPKGLVSLDTWEEMGNYLKQADRALNWCIGDWLIYGESGHVPEDKYLQAVGLFQKDHQTLKNLASVARRFPLGERRPGLDWSHHEAVRALPEIAREELLDEAEPLSLNEFPRLTVKALKERVRAYASQEEAAESEAPSQWIENLAEAGHVFQTVLADPDWSNLDSVLKLPVGKVVAEKSTLFLWTPDRQLFQAEKVFSHWGMFKLKRTLVWVDGSKHHLLLVATQGGAKADFSAWDQTHYGTQPITGEKRPSVFREQIELTFPGPRLMLFANGLYDEWCSYMGAK